MAAPRSNGERAHSLIGASSAYRWTICHGSPALIEKAPKQAPTIWAAEGTAAHKLAEVCFKTDNNAHRYIGKETENVEVTEEMAEAVQVYLDTVRKDRDSEPGTTLLIEEPFDLSQIYRGMFGTNDAALYVPYKWLRVYDYKHGAGEVVEVVENKQLLYYGLGAILKLGLTDLEFVELVIVQPRAGHKDGAVRRWRIDVDYLMAFAKELAAAAEATTKPDAPLVPGKHCKFCPALALCPAVAKFAQETAALDFPDERPTVKFPDPSLMSPEDLKKALDFSELLNQWVRSVEAYAEDCARRGVAIPGYKLVKKRGNRKWIDEAKVKKELEPLIGEKIYEERSILSPAQMEKALPKDKKMLVEVLADTPDTGVILVPESDEREAVPPAIETDFMDDL